MPTKTARNNLVRLLRSTLLVNAARAGAIADRSCPVADRPIHDAAVTVDGFARDGSGSFRVDLAGEEVGWGILLKGELDRWLASPRGVAAVAARDAEDAAYEASIRHATVVELRVSDRFPGTAELELSDGQVVPMIPVEGEDGRDLVALFPELAPGTAVRLRVVPAADLPDAFARTLRDDQPCVDHVTLARAA